MCAAPTAGKAVAGKQVALRGRGVKCFTDPSSTLSTAAGLHKKLGHQPREAAGGGMGPCLLALSLLSSFLRFRDQSMKWGHSHSPWAFPPL